MADVKKRVVNKPDAARLAAVRLLYSVLEEGAYTNLSAISLLEQEDLNNLDRAFATAAVYGTISWLPALDWYLSKLADRPVDRLDPMIRTILRLGLWQIIKSKSIPVSAAVNESVKIADNLLHSGAAAYVNAVLRSYERKTPVIPNKLTALKYGLPTFMFGLLKKWYGQEDAIKIAEAFLENKPWTSLRVNTMKIPPEDLIKSWCADELEAEKGNYLPEAVKLKLSGHTLRDLIAWQNGLVTSQDEAAMLTSTIADPQMNWLIYDLCAAPGGKTTHMAEIIKDSGSIIAIDSQPHRLKLINEQTERLGISSISTACADATDVNFIYNEIFENKTANLVLADVPCSGLGLLARKPEIRINMTYEKIQNLQQVQKDILKNAARLVSENGFLVYSTCTINPDENENQMTDFLENSEAGKNFQRVDIRSLLPIKLLEKDPGLAEQAKNGFIQLLPHKHDIDGFFISKLQKTKKE